MKTHQEASVQGVSASHKTFLEQQTTDHAPNLRQYRPSLLPALRETLQVCDRADFCVGYFNLRGWKADRFRASSRWSGGTAIAAGCSSGCSARLRKIFDEILSFSKHDDGIDNQTRHPLKKKLAEEFRDQLIVGLPTNEDEAGLRGWPPDQGQEGVVKLFLRHPLHAKLYLLFRPDPINPIVGYLGSSNLTFAGLSHQGELNVDVLDHDACNKLANWFEDRWDDRWCIDISDELVQDHRGELGARGAAPALSHLPQDGLSPLAGGADRPDGVPHPARISATSSSSFRSPPSRSPPTI